jgi:hypothetical protein
MIKEKLVKIYTLARILKVSVSWLQEQTESRKIPYLNAGGDILYSPDAVKAILEKRAAATKEHRKRPTVLSEGAGR